MLTESAASTCTMAPIWATPCPSRTTPETEADGAATQTPEARESSSVASPSFFDEHCTVSIILCVHGFSEKTSRKGGPLGQVRLELVIANTIRVTGPVESGASVRSFGSIER
jgi:hypothetical protein